MTTQPEDIVFLYDYKWRMRKTAIDFSRISSAFLPPWRSSSCTRTRSGLFITPSGGRMPLGRRSA
jgi:hypothetical protein